MSSLRTDVFDLDDTLIDTGPLYKRVLETYAKRVHRLLPEVKTDQLLKIQEEIDIRLVQEMGFTRDRFALSLVQSYERLALNNDATVDISLQRELWDLGHSVFDTIPPLFPDALDVLDQLHGTYELLLFTTGVPEIQTRKVEHHGLERLFGEVHVVPSKSASVLKGVLKQRQPASVMVVGDSLRGEVGPALELGCHAVLLRRPQTWRFHEAEVSGKYHVIEQLAELSPLLKREGLAATANA